jgi:small subunit ribosomal protein S20
MAHTKSAKKRIKTNEKSRLRNKNRRTGIKTTEKKLRAAAAAGDLQGAGALYQQFSAALDKGVKEGIIHRNMASRKKSRLALFLGSKKSAAPAPAAQA